MNRNVEKGRKALCFALTLFLSIYLMQGVSFAADSRTISQSVSQSKYEQGETFIFSVSLGGSENSISVSQIKGEVEYDTALFTITGVSAAGMVLSDANYEEGVFTLAADTARTLNKGDLLFQVQMKVRENRSVGKTTICVTHVELESESGNVSIVNMVPFSITILQSTDSDDSLKEDGSGEDLSQTENTKSNQKSPKTPAAKVSGLDKNNEESTKAGNQSGATNKRIVVPAEKQLDKNYKTDAGFGNGWYFVIALGFGAAAFMFYLVYRKVSSANNWES